MKTVNGYFLVRSQSSEQKSGGIFVAMSNDTKFLKCEVVMTPSGLKELGLETDPKFIYAFKDKLREVSVEGENLFLIDYKDIIAVS